MSWDPESILMVFLAYVGARVLYLKIRYSIKSHQNGNSLELGTIATMTLEVLAYCAVALMWARYWGIEV